MYVLAIPQEDCNVQQHKPPLKAMNVAYLFSHFVGFHIFTLVDTVSRRVAQTND